MDFTQIMHELSSSSILTKKKILYGMHPVVYQYHTLSLERKSWLSMKEISSYKFYNNRTYSATQ
jgi:hypothetical protein